ncbi:hypothetical protein BKA69DRAFT_1038350 [Paraphysoderma sedebokerense]|nr:hypothetical protein BKA69DRAFT_1038350 [Paraphysoderma sedebokerense]
MCSGSDPKEDCGRTGHSNRDRPNLAIVSVVFPAPSYDHRQPDSVSTDRADHSLPKRNNDQTKSSRERRLEGLRRQYTELGISEKVQGYICQGISEATAKQSTQASINTIAVATSWLV